MSAPAAGGAPRIPLDVREDLEWDYVRFQLDRMLDKGLQRLASEPPGPVRELHLELTHRCNLKCVMCEHWEIEHLDPASVAREMDFASIKRIVEESTVLKTIANIVVTGGEPWLRHDFVDVISWLALRFPQAGIIALTNFWNTGHMRLKLSELRARGVKNLRLGSSLDGLGETHDRIRGQHGAFSGLVKTVSAVRAEFPDYPFGFTFTITPDNVDELYKTYVFVARELGASLGAQWVVENAATKSVPWSAETRRSGIDQIDAVIRDIGRRHGAGERMRSPERGSDGWLWSELLYWHYLAEYGRQPRRFAFFKRCTAGERHVMLDPEGGVFFCPVNRARTIGNAAATPLDELWRSAAAARERRYVDSCRCHCWLRCVGAPALDRLLRLAAASS